MAPIPLGCRMRCAGNSLSAMCRPQYPAKNLSAAMALVSLDSRRLGRSLSSSLASSSPHQQKFSRQLSGRVEAWLSRCLASDAQDLIQECTCGFCCRGSRDAAKLLRATPGQISFGYFGSWKIRRWAGRDRAPQSQRRCGMIDGPTPRNRARAGLGAGSARDTNSRKAPSARGLLSIVAGGEITYSDWSKSGCDIGEGRDEAASTCHQNKPG